MNGEPRSAAVVHDALVRAAQEVTDGSTLGDAGARALESLVRAGLATSARLRLATRYLDSPALGTVPNDVDADAAIDSWSAEVGAGEPRIVRRFAAAAARPFQSQDHATLVVVAAPPGAVPTVLVLEAPESAPPWTDDEVDQIAMLVDTVAFTGAAHDAKCAGLGLRSALEARRTPTRRPSDGPTLPGLAAVRDDAPPAHDAMTRSTRPPAASPTLQVEVPEVIRGLPAPTPKNAEPPTRVDNWMDQMKLEAALEAKALEREAARVRSAALPATPATPARAPTLAASPRRPGRLWYLLVFAVVVVVVVAAAWVAGSRITPGS